MVSKSKVRVGLLFLISLVVILAISCETEPKIQFKTGTFRGTVELPQGSTFKSSDVMIYVEEIPGYMQRANSDGSFVLTGLEENATYTLTFTTKSMGVSRDIVAKQVDDETVSGYAQRLEGVVAKIGEGTLLPRVEMKQMGIIKGQVQLAGQNDHVGIDVYVPGTSFGAKTDEQGYFKISYVPQGRYRLRVEKDRWQGIYKENLIVEESDGNTVPVTLIDGIITLKKGYGTATGMVFSSRICF